MGPPYGVRSVPLVRVRLLPVPSAKHRYEELVILILIRPYAAVTRCEAHSLTTYD